MGSCASTKPAAQPSPAAQRPEDSAQKPEDSARMAISRDPAYAAVVNAFQSIASEKGKCSTADFLAAMQSLGVTSVEGVDVETAFNEADTDGDGLVDVDEWLAWVYQKDGGHNVQLADALKTLGINSALCLQGTENWRMHGEDAPVFAEYIAMAMDCKFGSLVDAADKTIGPNDCLIIVDMQNDFIPKDSVNTKGGRLATTEGGAVAKHIVQLSNLFAERGGMVVATRDYHPLEHCSFLTQGGGCPPHCIQGNEGSYFYKPIGDCLIELLKAGKRAEVVFKGFHTDVESFGSMEYPVVPPPDRGPEFTITKDCPEERLYGCTSLSAWTGSFCLKSSNLDFEGDFNINSPPDVMAVYNRERLQDKLKAAGIQRVFVTGLVFDLCCMDTAINSVKAGFADTSIIMDCCRPCHVPGLGQIGTGFLNPLEPLHERMTANGVKLCPMAALLPGFNPTNPLATATAVKQVFPMALGPLSFKQVAMDITLHFDTRMYVAKPRKKEAQVFSTHGVKPEGTTSPKHKLTLDAERLGMLGVPSSAEYYVFANPLNVDALRKNARAWFPTMSTDAAFFAYGGFAYVDSQDQVVAAKALGAGYGLFFGAPQPWPKEFSAALAGRWSPVTIPFMVEKGAVLFAWVNPHEELTVGDKKWTVNAPSGAFAYLYHEDLSAEDPRDVYFAVSMQ